MADFAPDMKLVQLAGGSVEQIQRVVEAVESKLKADPEGVKAWSALAGFCCRSSWRRRRVLQGLLQKLYLADLVKVRSATR